MWRTQKRCTVLLAWSSISQRPFFFQQTEHLEPISRGLGPTFFRGGIFSVKHNHFSSSNECNNQSHFKLMKSIPLSPSRFESSRYHSPRLFERMLLHYYDSNKYLLLLSWGAALISCFVVVVQKKGTQDAFSCKYCTLHQNIFSFFLLFVHRSSQHLQQLNGLAPMFQHQDAEVKPCCCIFLRM